MNYNDLCDYIRRLHVFVEAQDNRIRTLETVVRSLEDDLKVVRSKPPIHVDKIEYKFDQLKVETLEGTLNIGLNPSDIQGMDEFAVGGAQPGIPPFAPADKMQFTMRIEEPILQTLESDVAHIINQFEQTNNQKIDDNYISFITEDIKKQLPNRIEFYLNQLPMEQRSAEHFTNHEQSIIDAIKNDIYKGIHTFLSNLPSKG